MIIRRKKKNDDDDDDDDNNKKEEGDEEKKDYGNAPVFTDIITGKGGGCIFLLHGSPGTGKTLTAEAVSEHLHVPLYMVTVGELGTTPEQLEDNLKKILELGSIWGATILLDEADIFLEARSRRDILRNAMVGIFLRMLEYHQGVLFLTTNRIACLDEAFCSRISVSIHYRELDLPTRRQIWINFLSLALHREDVSAVVDIETLMNFDLNGRQIRSCVRLGQALARTQGLPHLNMQHLLDTIHIAINFKNQFKEFRSLSKRPHSSFSSY